MTLFNALRSPGVRNVILVAHAAPDGRLFDSSFNEYPIGFFNDLSPTLESISIYSCHGEKVIERYGISEKLRQLPTYHERRTVYWAQGATLMGIPDVVPMKGLAAFVRKVDRWQSFEEDSSQARVKPLNRYCSIGIDGLRVREGTFAFLLNGEYVGSVGVAGARDAASSSGTLTLRYPCSLTTARPKNALVLKSIRSNGRSELATQPESMSGWITRARAGGPGSSAVPLERSALPEATHYRRADGSYQSSKWVF
jgi:hypothetical protein